MAHNSIQENHLDSVGVGELNADMSSSSGGRSAEGGTGNPASRGGEDVITYVSVANEISSWNTKNWFQNTVPTPEGDSSRSLH